MDGLRFSLHKQYDEFMKRNPHFDGTVSVFAHSLGSVLVYDILLETCEVMGIEHSDIEPPKPGIQTMCTILLSVYNVIYFTYWYSILEA